MDLKKDSRRPLRFTASTLALLSSISLSGACLADIVIIGSPDTPQLNKKTAKLLYMKKINAFPNGLAATPLDLPDHSELKWRFYKRVLGKKPAQVNSYWSRALFTGAGEPPETLESIDALKKRIQSGSGLIGYLDARDVDPSMNVIFKISE